MRTNNTERTPRKHTFPERLAAIAVSGAAIYGIWAASRWLRWGHVAESAREQADPLLDIFMPDFEALELHSVQVDAPVETTWRAACELRLLRSPAVQAIVKARELLLRAAPDTAGNTAPTLLDMLKGPGWTVLAESPGTALLAGTVTRPWEANVVFRAIPADQFCAFGEPGWVKIAVTLRAERLSDTRSRISSETRVIATEAVASARMRRYWACFSPGISTIRHLALRRIKREAERLTRQRARSE